MESFSQQKPSIFEEDLPPVYASFWVRVVAFLIDVLILSIPHFLLNRLTGHDRSDGFFMRTGSFGYAYTDWNFTTIVFDWLYFSLQESSPAAATLGKRALGLAVIREEGGRISFGQATGRYFGRILSTIILFIGLLMVLWTDRRQGLHDKMAGTIVVRK